MATRRRRGTAARLAARDPQPARLPAGLRRGDRGMLGNSPLQRDDGPSVMIQSCLPVRRWREESLENACARGGYVAAGLYDARAATLIASGAELSIALEARALLAEAGVLVAVVSLPCWSLFANPNEAYRADVLGDAPRLGVEAGSDFGWGRWLGPQGQFIGAASLGLMAARPGELCGLELSNLCGPKRPKKPSPGLNGAKLGILWGRVSRFA